MPTDLMTMRPWTTICEWGIGRRVGTDPARTARGARAPGEGALGTFVCLGCSLCSLCPL